MKEWTERYAAQGLQLVVDLAKITASASKPNAKKPRFAYRFNNYGHMAEFVTKQIELIEKENIEKANKKKAEKDALANHPIEVGTIFVESWGYDQTNITFYQVIRKTKSAVIIQRINKKPAPNPQEGFMCRHVVPCKDEFVGTETLQKTVKVMPSSHGNTAKKPWYYLSHKYGSYYVYENGDKGVYESWYA